MVNVSTSAHADPPSPALIIKALRCELDSVLPWQKNISVARKWILSGDEE